jgi:glycosyltransferase involved in cell wall biosynthesis
LTTKLEILKNKKFTLSKNIIQKQKIAIIWENKEIGGVGSYLDFILNNPSFENFDVTIYTNKTNHGSNILKKKLINKKNIKYVNYKSFLIFESSFFLLKLINYLLKPFFFLIQYLVFKILFFNKDFNIVVGLCGGYGSFRGEVAALLAYNKRSVKTLVVCHETAAGPMFLETLSKFIDRIISKNISSIISISKATRNSLHFKTDLFLSNKNLQELVIYIGVPKYNLEKKISIRNFDKDNKSIFNIGILSRIEPYKGHEDLCVAYSQLNRDIREKINIYFIGTYENIYKNKLLDLAKSLGIEKSVVFTGYLENTGQEIISNLDLLLCLTRNFEGFGISLAEAMSVKTPILSTNVGAIPEFLNLKNSYLINPSSPPEISIALSNFILNNDNWKKRAEIAFADYNTMYTSDKMCKDLLSHFYLKDKMK